MVIARSRRAIPGARVVMTVRRVVGVQPVVMVRPVGVVGMRMGVAVSVGRHRPVRFDVGMDVHMLVRVGPVCRDRFAPSLRMSVGMAMGLGMGMAMIMAVAVPTVIMVVVMMPVAMGVAVVVVVMVMVVAVIVGTGRFVLGEAVVVVVAAAMVVGAALGAEGAHHRLHGTAEAAHHVGENVVVLDEDRGLGDLGRGMAVADVPGDAGERERIGRLDREKPLGRRLHLDEAAVLQHQRVAVVEHDGLAEIEQEGKPAFGAENDAAPVPAGMVEGDAVDDLFAVDLAVAEDGSGTQHDVRFRIGPGLERFPI